ncbi:chemotaxis protein CheX [Puniceicoccaceae bacterium K14]|nr:chemotaxis protein CheX [Puniceicoccaceae bacterium K14]
MSLPIFLKVMTGIAQLPNTDLLNTLSSSLKSVFDTMLSYELVANGNEDFSGTKPQAPKLGGSDMNSVFVGSVGFVGEASGVIYLFLQEEFANTIAAKITGLEGDDLDYDIVTDVCGELTNMFSGSFKNMMVDIGYDSTLTIPTVLSGDELYISSLGVEKHLRQSFQSNGCDVVADLVLAEG